MAKLKNEARLEFGTPVGILKKFSIGIFNDFLFHNCRDVEKFDVDGI
jgi:hypothetical protein